MESLNEDSDDQTTIVGIILAIFVVLITLVVFYFRQKNKSLGRNILLTGLSDSGKTTIFTRLIHSKIVESYTSIIENVGEIRVNNSLLKIVDIPGHERLRYKFYEKHRSSMRALIYMINSVTVQKEIRDVAEYLYNLLMTVETQKNINVLILCNKMDNTLAKSSNVIKDILVKEINLLRTTKTSELETTDSSTKKLYLGKQGKTFDFNDLNCKIEFAECSTHEINSQKTVDINQLEEWFKKLV